MKVKKAIAIEPKPRSMLIFFALAFGISWAAWIPLALGSTNRIPLPNDTTLLRLFGAFGPFLAAILTTAVFEGRTGIGSILRRFFIWQVNLKWYLFVLFWPALLSLVTSGFYVLLGGAAPDFANPPYFQLYPLPPELKAINPLIILPFVFLQQMLLGSAMGEEPGWRGFALPRLQAARNPLGSSLILGFLWGLWHLPLYFIQNDPIAETPFFWMLVGLLADSILYTWIFNNTSGSLLLVLLFHAAQATTLQFLTQSNAHPAVSIALTWLLVGYILLRSKIFLPEKRPAYD